MYQEFRFHPHLERFGPVAAPVAGAAFGLGWTPCIGPVLGAVLGFAADGQDLARSTVLLVAYSLGLGVSFLAVGLAMGRLTRALVVVQAPLARDHAVSAAILAVFGVILLTDQPPRGHGPRSATCCATSASAGSSRSADAPHTCVRRIASGSGRAASKSSPTRPNAQPGR